MASTPTLADTLAWMHMYTHICTHSLTKDIPQWTHASLNQSLQLCYDQIPFLSLFVCDGDVDIHSKARAGQLYDQEQKQYCPFSTAWYLLNSYLLCSPFLVVPVWKLGNVVPGAIFSITLVKEWHISLQNSDWSEETLMTLIKDLIWRNHISFTLCKSKSSYQVCLPCWWVTGTLEEHSQLGILHCGMLGYEELKSLPEHWLK